MKRIITFLLIVFSITASAQNAYWFANYRPTDTAKTPCWLKFAGGAVMPYYATGDTTIFAGWDINGNLVGRKMVMVANTNQNIDSTLAHGNIAVGKRMIMLSRTQSGSYTWETIVDTNIIATGYYQSGTFTTRAGLYSLGGSNTGYGVLELDTLLNYRSRIHPPKAQTGPVDLYMSNTGGTMARAEDSTTFIETIAAANNAVAGMVKNGGNSFGAGMSVGTNDSNSVTVKANGKNWSIMNARGRWVFNSSSSNADTAAGATAAVKITDTVGQTGTSSHSGITYYMTNTGTLTPNLLTLYYNGTQMLAVGSNGSINAFGGWNSTGGVGTSSTFSGTGLAISRNSSTAGVAATINQQQAGTGSPLKIQQGGNPTDTFGNAGDNHQLGTATNTYKGRAVFAGDVDDLSSAVQGTGPVAGTVFKATAAVVTVNGSSSGSANFWMPQIGTLKVVVITMVSLNGTASWTFPTVFTSTPVVVNSDAAVTSLSNSAVTVTGSTTSRTIVLLGN